MQVLLTARGFAVEADGYFEPGTRSAVKAFQRAHELDDDGIVGPFTWAALEGALRRRPRPMISPPRSHLPTRACRTSSWQRPTTTTLRWPPQRATSYRS